MHGRDVTDRACRRGWRLPFGWTVTAQCVADCDSTPYEADCYTREEIAAWQRDDWAYVGVIVEVVDDHGRVLADDSLWSVEQGTFPCGERDHEIDPLLDEQHPVPDLIDEACEAARLRLDELRSRHIEHAAR